VASTGKAQRHYLLLFFFVVNPDVGNPIAIPSLKALFLVESD
jgi:hypothetical protein